METPMDNGRSVMWRLGLSSSCRLLVRTGRGRCSVRHDNIAGETEHAEEANNDISVVHLPPVVAVLGRSWIRVMIVVPAFTSRDDAETKIVPAMVIRGKVAISPQVRDRIDRPSNVPDHNSSHNDAPK